MFAAICAVPFALAAISPDPAGESRPAVVTVSPEDMRGWTIATNRGATAGLADYGPAVFERASAWVADDGTNLGRGAFFATTDFGGSDGTPPSAWLGLDTFKGEPLAGIALRRITKMEYYAYVAHIPVATSNPAHWDSWKAWYKYPRNPISLQLTAESPDGKQRKQFWFLPWHARSVKGDNCGMNAKAWLRYDCIAFNSPGPNMVGRWYTYGPPEREFAAWADVVAAFGDWRLIPTSDAVWPAGWKSAGWDETTSPPGAPTSTATGRCLNFEIGARKTRTDIFFEADLTWRNFYQGFRGYVDRFTLGIDGDAVTYDFEPAADAKPAAVPRLTNAEAYDRAAKRPAAHRYEIVEIAGQCVERNAAVFKLEDGSGRIIEGILYKGTGTKTEHGENPAQVGEWWSVRGYLERPVFEPADGPLCIWTAASHMKKMK